MNTVPLADTTSNMPLEFWRASNALQNRKQRKEASRLFTRARPSVDPSKKSGTALTCPVLNVWKPSCRRENHKACRWRTDAAFRGLFRLL